MLLVAMLDGQRVDATTYSPEAWKELQNSEDRKRMVLPLCGVRAVAMTRGRNTRYFAHHGKRDCEAAHGGETPQHIAMKEALRSCIERVPGWQASVEHQDPLGDWTVDVLAKRDDAKYMVAFEVQLSPQSPSEYFKRSQRYFDSGLFPVWLVPHKLEYDRIKVPVVVTGYGKTSPVPTDAFELLLLPAHQDFVKAGRELGAFVEALLRIGHSWKLGSPRDQAERERAKAAREAVQAEAERRQAAALEARIAVMNENSASTESAFGQHVVRTETDTYIWGSLTTCQDCAEPMLVWDARSPGFRKRWVKVPGPRIKPDVGPTRIENLPEIHHAVDAWAKAVKADVRKALIKPRRTGASGRLYSAFVCPSCDTTMGQYFISRIPPNKWSIISGPTVDPVAVPPSRRPAPAARVAGGAKRCRIHSVPSQACKFCRNAGA
ncbi:competence protein CoiA family protein [Arthrobacter sp. NQ7]|uniref:competence protein CoiA family protein n=1 Tax=Arthrobacter sp. NQ7 TaxID=3032303 RepID=UPI00240ED25C|nr:competence protein CoiA family protein [Arthrobacter sp. NQ7]MDJ0459314.1 competence protein CoiA family protein [Arthrobacter sp. NQ7]